MNKSVVLIGMPGAGKSTVGVLLAKELGLDFIDTDITIQAREGKTLQQIMDEHDYLHLRDIEESALLEADIDHKVVSTGGSVVYSEAVMARLKTAGVVVYLEVPLAELKNRIHNYEERGIARRPDQSFAQLFAERASLYNKFADIRIDCSHKSIQEVLEELLQRLVLNKQNPKSRP